MRHAKPLSYSLNHQMVIIIYFIQKCHYLYVRNSLGLHDELQRKECNGEERERAWAKERDGNIVQTICLGR